VSTLDRTIAKDHSVCLSVYHTSDPHQTVQDIEILSAPYDTAMILVFCCQI